MNRLPTAVQKHLASYLRVSAAIALCNTTTDLHANRTAIIGDSKAHQCTNCQLYVVAFGLKVCAGCNWSYYSKCVDCQEVKLKTELISKPYIETKKYQAMHHQPILICKVCDVHYDFTRINTFRLKIIRGVEDLTNPIRMMTTCTVYCPYITTQFGQFNGQYACTGWVATWHDGVMYIDDEKRKFSFHVDLSLIHAFFPAAPGHASTLR